MTVGRGNRYLAIVKSRDVLRRQNQTDAEASLTEERLRGIIRDALNEDLMRGVPEFVIYEISGKAVSELRKHVQKHVALVCSSPQQVRESMQACEGLLKKLNESMVELIEDRLWELMRVSGS
jgi:flavorubredoxin